MEQQSNIERVSSAIWEAQNYGLVKPHDIAAHLNEENLIAPELPKPNGELDGNPEWFIESNRISVGLYEDLSIAMDHLDEDSESIAWPTQLTPDEAREIAYSLLAAANHAEKGTP